jgi:hypothetical protein
MLCGSCVHLSSYQPLPSPDRLLLIIINPESVPLLRSHRFLQQSHYQEATGLFSVTCEMGRLAENNQLLANHQMELRDGPVGQW